MARQGEIIDGKYEVLREVGRGGMSVVYLAMDRRLNKQWAIKEFRKDKDDASKEVALKALLDEANLMKKLDHPTLPRIVDIIETVENVYVIMDYIEGESLNKVLDAYGAQPQDAVIEWAKQLSEVLDYLHTQNPPVIYRDMKPANIMLKPDGTVRLIDFGIAREYKEGKEGDTDWLGTRGYAAPEQFGGKGQTDARTDIYSLGVTLYHLLTGKNPAEPPYEIYPIRHWDPSFSGGLEWLIQKCTQLNPEDRYQSCAEITYVLENLDKFDATYKRKQKSRLSLFLVSAIMAAVFTLTSIASFVGSVSAKKNTYDELVANGSFLEAIEIDGSRVDGYVKLAEHLSGNVSSVVTGDGTGQVGTHITTGDLGTWFDVNHISRFETTNPVEYARIQFEWGFLLWTYYTKGDDELKDNKFDKDLFDLVMPHFKEVLEVQNNNSDLSFAGLSEKEYTLARVLYCVIYFYQNADKLKSKDDRGNGMAVGELEIFAGVDSESFENGVPYKAYWNTMIEALEYLNENPSLTESSLKVKVLNHVGNVIGTPRFYTEFKNDGVTKEDYENMINLLNDNFQKVNDENKKDYIDVINENIKAVKIDFDIDSELVLSY